MSVSVTELSALVAEAARCDAAGAHQRAIGLLLEAVRGGDVEAMTRLGKRLLSGVNAPDRPDEGAALIMEATRLGNAEAAAQLAALAAIGMFVPQDWGNALTALAFSAERGSPDARGQLRVLTVDRELARNAEAADAPPAIWRRMAETIDLERWHSLPAGETLSESPLVRRFPDLLDDGVCRWLIDRARGRLERAPVYSASQQQVKINETRTNTWAMFDILRCDVVSVLAQVRMCRCTGAPFRHLEPLHVLHYDVGEEITGHFDFVDPLLSPSYERELAEKGQRRVTFLIYLNDDYDGGETEMPQAGLAHKGARGEGLYFVNALPNGQPDRRTLHAGRPPTRGEKWIVSQFIRDRPMF